MPLTMPCRRSPRLRDQPVEPHAELGRADFLGIGRADRGDRAGRLQPGLEEADAAIIFDAVDRKGTRRQAELGEDPQPKCPWKAMLWMVITVACRGRSAVAQIGGRQRRLPVMRMDDIGQLARDRAAGDVGRRPGERGEALPVVGPVLAAEASP